MYAVLDIEATGGQVGEEDIIEIAIYKYNGKEVVDQFMSLVSPERKIDPYVQKLTKITTKMVRTAPKFHELAKRIVEITENTILVGHNVEFDYRMLRQEFAKLGYNYKRKTIDTHPLSEKYFPDTNSHSLGKLCKELGIPVSGRHRAAGDARATLELFKLLLEKDAEKKISRIASNPDLRFRKFEEFYKGLPNAEGVFYFKDKAGNVIYLAATHNIAQSVRKLLTSVSNSAIQIQMYFENVSYDLTGNEVLSFVKEINELQKLKPGYNKKFKNNPFRYYLSLKKTEWGKTLEIQHSGKMNGEVFLKAYTRKSAEKIIATIYKNFDIHKGEVISEEKILLLKEAVNFKDKTLILTGKGRTSGEKSFILIVDNVCKGYGYYEYYNQIDTLKRIKERMTPSIKNKNIIPFLQNCVIQEKHLEIVYLDTK